MVVLLWQGRRAQHKKRSRRAVNTRAPRRQIRRARLLNPLQAHLPAALQKRGLDLDNCQNRGFSDTAPRRAPEVLARTTTHTRPPQHTRHSPRTGHEQPAQKLNAQVRLTLGSLRGGGLRRGVLDPPTRAARLIGTCPSRACIFVRTRIAPAKDRYPHRTR